MEKFVKGPTRDPFLVTPNDFNPGFFGHLNALVDAITALEQGGSGPGGGGNPISVWFGSSSKVFNLSKLTFSGNVTVALGDPGEALINIPPIANNSIGLGKLSKIAPGLLGNYTATNPNNVQTIAIGDGLSLDPITGMLTSTATGTVVSSGTGISVTGGASTPTVSLATVGSASAGVALATISVDAYGRVTSATAGSISNVTLATGTISGIPSGGTDIVNKSFVETYVQGLLPKASVKLATTVNLPTLAGTIFVDGIKATVNSRVLVKDQTDSTQNGIYKVGAVSPFTWTRTTDADTIPLLVSAYVFVEQGATNADSGWVCTVDTGATINVSPIPWSRFTSVASYSAGEGIAFTNGTTINVKTTLDGSVTGKNPGSFGGTASGDLSSVIPKFAVDLTGRITSIENFNPLINLASNLNVGTSILTGINGGTGFNNYAKGDTLYANANGTVLNKLAIGSAGKVLTVSATGVPEWKDAPSGFTNPMGTEGQIIYQGPSGPLALDGSTVDGYVLTYDDTNNKPKWAVATGSNPTDAIGDIIYASAAGSPAPLDNLAIGTVGQYLRVVESPASSGNLLPKWANGVTTGTVVSFVIDGYGGPIVAAGNVTVFIAKIPFIATYNSLSVSADQSTGAGTINVTASGGVGSISCTIPTASNSLVQSGSMVFATAGGTLTFTVNNASNTPITKLFVNLTGIRS